MGKTAFVTGGAGFLGRHLIEELLSTGWEVTALIRSEPPSWMRLPNLAIRKGSLDDHQQVLAAMPERPDAVFHVAGAISMWSGDMDVLMRDNVTATRHLLDAALERRAARVVATSTLGVFEAEGGPVSELNALRPVAQERNPYLQTKLMADQELQKARRAGLSTVSIHPSHLLGPHDHNGWIKMFDDALAGKLKAAPRGRANFCSVEAVARAHVTAALRPDASPRYVLGGPTASYLDMFNAIANRTGVKPVTATVPPPVLKTVARLSDWWSRVDGKRPELTPGLAEILSGDMLADDRLACRDLGYRSEDLSNLLDRVHIHWSARQSTLALARAH